MIEETVRRLAKASGKKYGGKLKNWSIHNAYGDIKFVMGTLSGPDPTYRWKEGYIVKTSNVVWIEADFDYVETANTFYVLEGSPNPEPLPDTYANKVFF